MTCIAVVVMGVSGSGKTSVGMELARMINGRFIEGDDLHPVANIEKMSAAIPLEDSDRWSWLDSIGDEIAASVATGINVVASCSALKLVYRERLRLRVGKTLRFLFLKVSADALYSRVEARTDHFMPAALLASQLAALEPPVEEPDVLAIDVARPLEEIVTAAFQRFTDRWDGAGAL